MTRERQLARVNLHRLFFPTDSVRRSDAPTWQKNTRKEASVASKGRPRETGSGVTYPGLTVSSGYMAPPRGNTANLSGHQLPPSLTGHCEARHTHTHSNSYSLARSYIKRERECIEGSVIHTARSASLHRTPQLRTHTHKGIKTSSMK